MDMPLLVSHSYGQQLRRVSHLLGRDASRTSPAVEHPLHEVRPPPVELDGLLELGSLLLVQSVELHPNLDESLDTALEEEPLHPTLDGRHGLTATS